MENMKKGSYLIALFSNILLISKASLLALLPGFILILFYSLRRGHYKKCGYALSASLCLGVQGIYIIVNSMSEVRLYTINSVCDAVLKSIFEFVIMTGDCFLNNWLSYQMRMAIAILILAFTIYVSVKLARSGREVYVVGIIFATLGALGSIVLDVFSRNILSLGMADDYCFNFEWYGKNCFGIISFVSVLSIILIAYFYTKTGEKNVQIVALALTICVAFTNCYYEDHTAGMEGGYPVWAINDKTSQCMPINAKGLWARLGSQKLIWYGKDCFERREHPVGSSVADEWNAITEEKYIDKLSFPVPVNISTLFCEKATICQTDNIYAVLFDSDGKIVETACPLQKSIANCGLVYEVSAANVSQLCFITEDSRSIDIVANVYVVSKENNSE